MREHLLKTITNTFALPNIDTKSIRKDGSMKKLDTDVNEKIEKYTEH